MASLHPDHQPLLRLTKRQRVDKAVHTLEGIMKGIAIDGRLVPEECRELTNWCEDNKELLSQHPFTELIGPVRAALADGVISSEEQRDILWLCRNLSAGSSFYDDITNDVQILHGILHGILADGVVTDDEAKGLSKWLDENSHLCGSYPFEELNSLLTNVLRDGRVDEQEQRLLRDFFGDFISYSMSKRIQQARTNAVTKQQLRLPGICASCPEITFEERHFCFTGASTRAVRREIAEHVVNRRGVFRDSVNRDLHYLVIGAAGNPCWAYACYGRKVEEAVTLRREGHRLLIVHENDFWDAVQDNPV
jgi:hypothetical protein